MLTIDGDWKCSCWWTKKPPHVLTLGQWSGDPRIQWMPVCSSPKKPWKSNTHPNKWIPGDRWHMMTDQNSLSANHLTNQVFFLSKTTKVLPPESTNGQHFQASRLAMFDQQGFLMFQQPLVVSKSALSTLIKHFNSNNLKPYSFQKGQHSKMFQTNKGNQRICRNVLCDDAWCLIVLRISAGHSPKSESILVKSCSNIALWTSRALHVTDCSCRLARTSDFIYPFLKPSCLGSILKKCWLVRLELLELNLVVIHTLSQETQTERATSLTHYSCPAGQESGTWTNCWKAHSLLHLHQLQATLPWFQNLKTPQAPFGQVGGNKLHVEWFNDK